MLLIGLQNSGKIFANTVHNLGSDLAYNIISHFDNLFSHKVITKNHFICPDGNYEFYTYKLLNCMNINIIFLNGFINDTGCNLLSLDEKIEKIIINNEIIALYDDIGLKTGQVIMSFGKGTSRHNGARGLDEFIGKKYWRIRIGYTKEIDICVKDFVLSKVKNSKIYSILFILSKKIVEIIVKSKLNEFSTINNIQNIINTNFIK